jgi:hypothetical protein
MNTRESNGVRYLGPYRSEAEAMESAQAWAPICTGGVEIVKLDGKWFVYRKGTY